MSVSANTANAIAALLQGFRQGSQDVQNRRLQERKMANQEQQTADTNAFRTAQLNMPEQKLPMLSGDLFNQAFKRGAGFNPGLPPEIPAQAGGAYTRLLSSMRILRQQAEAKKAKEKALRDLRKGFREREKLLQTSIDKSREKILAAQTNLLANPNDPEAARTILMMKAQQEMQQSELKQLRQKAASAGLPEFAIMNNADSGAAGNLTSPSAPSALPGLPGMPDMSQMGTPSADSNSNATLNELMGLMGK